MTEVRPIWKGEDMERLKLRGRIIERFGTIGAFVEALGITANTATNVLSGKTTPTSRMLPRWCDALDIDPAEVGIFFTVGPQKTEETA